VTGSKGIKGGDIEIKQQKGKLGVSPQRGEGFWETGGKLKVMPTVYRAKKKFPS